MATEHAKPLCLLPRATRPDLPSRRQLLASLLLIRRITLPMQKDNRPPFSRPLGGKGSHRSARLVQITIEYISNEAFVIYAARERSLRLRSSSVDTARGRQQAQPSFDSGLVGLMLTSITARRVVSHLSTPGTALPRVLPVQRPRVPRRRAPGRVCTYSGSPAGARPHPPCRAGPGRSCGTGS